MFEDDKAYDYFKERYMGSAYGDLRRERAALQKRLIFNEDASVKPRIRELTLEITNYLKGKNNG